MSGSQKGAESAPSSRREVHVYTDGASTGSRGPGGYGAVISFQESETVEISGGARDTTNLRMEITAACAALERIGEGHTVTVYADASYLVNCMRRGWHEKWRKNGWLNHRKRPVARHQEVRWKKVKGHSRTAGPHKRGNDRADELAVTAKNQAQNIPTMGDSQAP